MKAVMVVCRMAMESRGDRTKKSRTLATEWEEFGWSEALFFPDRFYKYPDFVADRLVHIIDGIIWT